MLGIWRGIVTNPNPMKLTQKGSLLINEMVTSGSQARADTDNVDKNIWAGKGRRCAEGNLKRSRSSRRPRSHSFLIHICYYLPPYKFVNVRTDGTVEGKGTKEDTVPNAIRNVRYESFIFFRNKLFAGKWLPFCYLHQLYQLRYDRCVILQLYYSTPPPSQHHIKQWNKM